MLDAPPHTRLDRHERPAAHAYAVAPSPSGSRPAWCVVATFSQAERRAHASLHRFGFEPYLPLVTVRLPNRHYHTRPLFPGYVFVRLDLARPWHPVTFAPGVFQLLKTDGAPAVCPDTAVEAVRSAVDGAEASAASEPAWKPGTPCTLVLGPFTDMPAVVLSVHRNIAQVGIMCLGALRSVSVDVACLVGRE